MTPHRMHQIMEEVVAHRSCPLNPGNRDDFFDIDSAILNREWHPGARMLWIARRGGTHLVTLGVHPDVSREAIDAMAIAEPMDIYIATNAGLEKIDRARALRELAAMEWSNREGLLSKGGEAIATIAPAVAVKVGGRFVADVHLAPSVDARALKLGDAIGLSIYARRAAIEAAGGFFCMARSVMFGSESLASLIGHKREPMADEATKTPPKVSRGRRLAMTQ